MANIILRISTSSIVIVAVAAFVIFYQFLSIPKYLFGDEIEFARLALSLNNGPYIPYSELATGHSTLYFYIILFSLKLFGISNFALRFPAAVFGIVSVLLFFKILQKVYYEQLKNKYLLVVLMPLIITVLLASSRWYFNFARFAFEVTFLLFLELSSLLLILEYLKNKKLVFILLSAVFAGLAFHSYTPGRIFFIIPFFLLITSHRKHLLSFFFIFLLTISPLLFYFLTHPDVRVEDQFYLKSSKYSAAQKISMFGENITKTILMFSLKGDMNGRHNYPGKPALNGVLSILLIIGLIETFRQYKKKHNQLFLLYFLVSLFPTLLSNPQDNPNMLRTYTVLPSVFYFIGNGLLFLFEKLKKWKNVFFAVIFTILLLSCAYELRTYFYFQKDVFTDDATKTKKKLQQVVQF